MLVANNVHFSYSKKAKLFDGVEFSLEPGTICGLLGKNGAGKTSLLRLIVGAQFADQGTIRFEDRPVQSRKVATLQSMFFLQEDFELPKMTAEAYVNTYSVFYPEFDRRVFENVLDRFEVPRTGKLRNLSFGQQKKFQVAFALATQVSLLILDEPTNGMDIPSKAVFRSVVSESLGESQTIIISTHQIRDLGQLLDRILLIQTGKIIVDEALYNLAEQFNCQFCPGNTLPPDTLYSEPVAGGSIAVVPAAPNEPGEIDIEILFNAIISNPSILSKTTTHGI